MSRDTPIHPADEERLAADMARELDGIATAGGVRVSDDFADRIMAAVAAEPLPQPVRAFGVALVAGHLRAAAAAVGDAWRVVSSGVVPIGVRAQALALVLVIAVGSLTIAGGATVGAIGLLGPDQAPPSPSPVVPSPSPSVAPSPSIDPSPSATTEPSASVEPSETAGPTSTGTAPSRTATPSPTGTDDHGGGSGSGSGSSGSGQTPEPAETPRPDATARTPDPTDTPEPAGTDDSPGDS